MEEDLRARLLADAGLTARVATRVDWVERPKATGLPAITLTLISRVLEWTYNGASSLVASRIQVDVWGVTAKDVITIARLLPAILFEPATQGTTRFARAFLDLEQDGGTEEIVTGTLIYRRILDFTLWHSPA